jgi:protocatechuate 3,4-dioxygenase beta subunit
LNLRMMLKRPAEGVHPPNDSPAYRSTALRHPKRPLIVIPQTLAELFGSGLRP